MKKDYYDLTLFGIIVIFFLIMIGVIIYDAATTTYEYISTSGKVVDKEVQHIHKPIYEEDEDGFRRIAKYEDEVHYFLICDVDNDEVKVQINFMDYIKYKINDIAPLTKIIGYKKGSNEVKRIFYELRKI